MIKHTEITLIKLAHTRTELSNLFYHSASVVWLTNAKRLYYSLSHSHVQPHATVGGTEACLVCMFDMRLDCGFLSWLMLTPDILPLYTYLQYALSPSFHPRPGLEFV